LIHSQDGNDKEHKHPGYKIPVHPVIEKRKAEYDRMGKEIREKLAKRKKR